MRRPTLLVDLSRKAARQKLISDCRHWVLGTFGIAVAVSCVPAGLYFKAFLWLLFAACSAYYVHVLRTPIVDSSPDSSSAQPVRYAMPTVVSSSISTLASPSQPFSSNSATAARLDTALRSLPSSPEPPSLASYNFAEASKLTDDMLRTRKTSLEESSLAAGFKPRVSSPHSSLLTASSSSALLGSASTLYGTAPLTATPHRPPSHHGYQLSPLSLLHSPTAPPDRSASLGVAKYGGLTLRVRDGLQALQLSQIRDEWVDALRSLLGKHLLSLLKLFDEAVEEITPWLSRVAGASLPAEDVKRIVSLVDYSAEERFVRLSSTGQKVSLEDVLALCKQGGIPQDTLHRYTAATSFLRVCQQMAEGKASSSSPEEVAGGEESGSSGGSGLSSLRRSSLWGWEASPFSLSSTSSSTSSVAATSSYSSLSLSSHSAGQHGRRKPKSFVSRLKDMMFHSMDGRLRVQWPASAMLAAATGGGGGGQRRSSVGMLSDQEIAVALFLHKCDSLAAWKPAFSSMSGKFSQVHYAASAKELHRLVASLTPSASASSASSASSSASSSRATDSSEGWCICLLLQPPSSSSASSSLSAAAGDGKDGLSASTSSSTPSSSSSNPSGTASSTSSSSSSSSSAASLTQASPHVDVVWANLRGGHASSHRELLLVERGRNDVFEAVLVFLMVVFLTYQYSDEDYSDAWGRPHAARDRGAGGGPAPGTASPIVDYVVAKDLLREILGSEGLDALLSPAAAPLREKDGAGSGSGSGAGGASSSSSGSSSSAGMYAAFASPSPAAAYASHAAGLYSSSASLAASGLLSPLSR